MANKINSSNNNQKKIRRTNLEIETEKDMIFKFVCKFLKENNYAPTVRDIISQKELGISSTATAMKYIDRLVLDGKLLKSDKKSRAINLAQPLSTIDEDSFSSSTYVSKIPFLGNTAAGLPLNAAVENDRSYFIPNDYFDTRQENFLLQIKGDSMVECGILDGDVVLIKKASTAYDGQIVLAQFNNEEVTLKRFYKGPSYIRLHPENSNYSDIIVKNNESFRILGIANGLMRNHIV